MRISFPNQSAKGHAFQRHQMEIAFLMLFSIALYGSEDHRHSNSGPPFFLIWSLPRLWYGSLSGSISLNRLSIFYNISCYNSLVLLTFVSRSSCHITYIYIKVRNNRQNTKRESSLRLDILPSVLKRTFACPRLKNDFPSFLSSSYVRTTNIY